MRIILTILFLALLLTSARLTTQGAEIYLVGPIFTTGLLAILLTALARRALIARKLTARKLVGKAGRQ